MGALIISVITLGCKVNYCESGSIISRLIEMKHQASEGLIPADVYIINTCSVTAEADRKSRQYISKCISLNPHCKIIIIGCSAQNNPERFYKNNVIAVGGTQNKEEFVVSIIENIDNLRYNTLSDRILSTKNDEISCNNPIYGRESTPKSDKTRTFVKIQDGCNRFCSYCIIPYLRGRSRSRAIEDIVNECLLSDSNEIVLTGIDISVYGVDIGCDLPQLMTSLKPVKARKRLGSLECEVVDDRLLNAALEADFCPHFHLSLQSGSDTVLKTMNRRYDTEYFYSKVELIRKYFPNAGITTDIIVGFPTETDELFADSIKFIDKCAFSDIHVFPYSSRTGTLASKKYSVLPKTVVTSRVKEMLDIKKRTHERFIAQNLKSVMPVYVEDSENGYNVGYTPNYIRVYSDAPCGKISDVKLLSAYEDGALGERV